ncbi:hypothetical protein [Nitrosovibrio sp. Nv6]|uniref:hypothetical protein n=1 Tax=Nitrosovibrio sp. Nv6 TaxID=1855340 RepID=UPI0008ADCD9D|nr:hypothetical protein [Nitrosovibrio sp. Nv6]SEO65392.1 hypothetical protein SAMN05216316_0718 [Nitrosovibrio sp. Nv6]
MNGRIELLNPDSIGGEQACHELKRVNKIVRLLEEQNDVYRRVMTDVSSDLANIIVARSKNDLGALLEIIDRYLENCSGGKEHAPSNEPKVH